MDYYNVGKIVNTHGVRGEVRVLATTDFIDERFNSGQILYLQQTGQPLALEIESARQHKGMILVKFIGYDNINDVQAFRGHELMVSADDQQELEDGQYYYHQIIGLTVQTLDGTKLGTIKEILSPGANDVWVVQRPDAKDLLLPVIDDVDRGIVEVELMEGLE